MKIEYIIGLSGYVGSGKDATAAILARYGYHRFAFADLLRKELSEWWKEGPIQVPVPQGVQYTLAALKVDEPYRSRIWQKPTTAAIRDALQFWGTDYKRWKHPRYWVDKLLKEIEEKDGPPGRIVISDMRYPNEYDMVKAYQGRCWRIERGSPVNNHTSEIALDFHEFDAYIQNSGTLEELERRVDRILHSYDTEARLLKET